MSDSTTRIGLLGLGYWGRNLFRNLSDMGMLAAACDTAPGTVAEFAVRAPGVRFCASPEEILQAPDLAAVAIATPAVTHYALVKAALAAGKHVFVEKPLALTVAEGEELAGLAAKAGRVLMVGHILRYHPAVLKLEEMVRQGQLGRLQYIYSNRLNIGKLRTEENILWSFAPHDISVILDLVGQAPAGVSCCGGAYLNAGVSDTTVTCLDFAEGVRAHIFVSWLHPFKEQKLVVVGSQGMAVFDDMAKDKLVLYPHRIEWKEGRLPVAQKAEQVAVPVPAGEPLRAELEHFVDCVKTGARPRTDAVEGLAVLRVLDAAQRALESGSRIPLGPAAAKPGFFVHESAYVDDDCTIGADTKVWHFSHVLPHSRIGAGCVIGQNCSIGPDVTIGNGCKIQNNVSVYKGVTLEDDVFCGPSCVFTNVYNPRSFINRRNEFRQTLVRRGASIGANATIVCGVTIGRYAFVAAGAVVKADVPDYALMAGVPARQKGWIGRHGHALRQRDADGCFVCPESGWRYREENGALRCLDAAEDEAR